MLLNTSKCSLFDKFNNKFPLNFFWQDDDFNKPAKERSDKHQQAFLAAVRSLGIGFSLFKNDKWKVGKVGLDVSAGRGNKVLLKKTPDLFEKFLPSAKVEKTRKSGFLVTYIPSTT